MRPQKATHPMEGKTEILVSNMHIASSQSNDFT